MKRSGMVVGFLAFQNPGKHMKSIIIATALAALSGTAQAAPRDDATAVANQVAQTERDFDAYTHVHGYAKGFYQYSAPDAVTFEPDVTYIHDELAKALAADNADKPSTLRWGPHYIGLSQSQDMAWDLGPWTVEGTDKAGWFLTMWQRQPDGSWLWTLDGGAGPDTATNLPARDTLVYSLPPHKKGAEIPGTADQVAGMDSIMNIMVSPANAYTDYNKPDWGETKLIVGDTAPPAFARADDGKPSANLEALWAARPKGLTWTRDGIRVDQAGDMAYTYGHASSPDGTYQGHYVRVWRHTADTSPRWTIEVDLYQSAKK